MSGETFTHEKLGEFHQDESFDDNYEGSAKWCGQNIRLILSTETGPLPKAANRAIEMMEKEQLWQAEIGDCIYSALYKTWDDVWREDEASLSKSEWLSRMSMSSLQINSEGQFDIYLNDGDLFWNHYINVSGSLADGAQYAQMLG